MDFHRINTQGRIWIQKVDDIDLIGYIASDEGRMLYSKSDEKIYIATSTEWLVLATKYSVLTSGSKLLFGSYPIPTGWNITAYNDIIALVTNSSSDVGSTAGSWTITGFNSGGSHDHGGTTGQSIYVTHSRLWEQESSSKYHVHSILSDGIHEHTFDGSWRPSHVKFCEATLQ